MAKRRRITTTVSDWDDEKPRKRQKKNNNVIILLVILLFLLWLALHSRGHRPIASRVPQPGDCVDSWGEVIECTIH
jgi:hypothetical protein